MVGHSDLHNYVGAAHELSGSYQTIVGVKSNVTAVIDSHESKFIIPCKLSMLLKWMPSPSQAKVL